MPTVSVSIDHSVEKKFEKLLIDFGYEYSKEIDDHEVSFVLTSEQELDLVEISLLNECARRFQQLEDQDKERFRESPSASGSLLLKLGLSNRNDN